MARRRYRYLSGERFRLVESGLSKKAALKLADDLRSEGKRKRKQWLARVIKAKGGYQVWWSPHDWFAR